MFLPVFSVTETETVEYNRASFAVVSHKPNFVRQVKFNLARLRKTELLHSLKLKTKRSLAILVNTHLNLHTFATESIWYEGISLLSNLGDSLYCFVLIFFQRGNPNK